MYYQCIIKSIIKIMIALFYAIRSCNFYEVSFLIESVVNVLEKDRNGETALHYASAEGNLKIVKFLVESGSNIYSFHVPFGKS